MARAKSKGKHGYSHVHGRDNSMQDVVNVHGGKGKKGNSYKETIKGKVGGKKRMK